MWVKHFFIPLFICWCAIYATSESEAQSGGPRPGDVYKEFALHNVGDKAWRVTSPQAENPGAKKYLPNPIWEITVDDLDGAVRAEIMMDRWGGHLDTINPQIRVNNSAWISIHPPVMSDGRNLPEDYYFQDNPVVPIPLELLKVGRNVFEGTCGHKKPGGWGQWGLYSLLLRVYYDPSLKPHAVGRIISPRCGDVITENPLILVDVVPDQVDRVDLFAWYEGYDENGDGRFRDWHGGWFKPYRDEPAEWQGHVGTIREEPFRMVWNTRYVPDQPPGEIRLIARIRHRSGVWSVTEEVSQLTLQRQGESVALYRTRNFPPDFGVRTGQRRTCVIPLPNNYNPENVVEASLHYRTWHGWDKHHAPYLLNDYSRPHEGKNHHYHYHIHLIPPEVLRAGENHFTIFSETDHHMLEILWPGPALIIRERQQHAKADHIGGW